MAKSARLSPPKPRGPAVGGPDGRDRRSFARGVWEELKKVIWPTRPELSRMTGIVIVTVVIFASLIGAADYGLGLAVRPLYTSAKKASATATPAPATTPTTRPAPSSPSAKPR